MAIDWKARVEQAKKARDEAKSKLTDDDREEIAARAEEAAIRAEQSAAEQEKRALDLERRFEAMREMLGPKALIAKVEIEDREDTFIIKCDPKAHAKWQQQTAEAVHNKKLDSAEIGRNYAVAVVIDWNGITDFGPTSLEGYKLIEYLKENTGMVAPITNRAARLAGFFAAEKKG